jgi:precorrin-4/cobalt-precorrin-4 C11-methyltransferase
MKVAFVGAGPGDPELITIKGRRLLETADLVIYAGSLVNPELLRFTRPGVPRMDSAGMTLDEVLRIYDGNADKTGLIVRLHTGDPSLYGAIQEQLDHCRRRGIPTEVVPGVSSVCAAAATLERELTIPGISQTVILTRAAGRTTVPAGEGLSSLAVHEATMAIFLSIHLMDEAIADLLPHYGPDCPVRVVHRASWPDQSVIEGTLSDIGSKAGGIGGQAMILVGRSLAAGEGDYERSKLYDPAFSHGKRKAAE